MGQNVLPYMVCHRYDRPKSWKRFHRRFDLKSRESKKSVVIVRDCIRNAIFVLFCKQADPTKPIFCLISGNNSGHKID